MNLQVPTDKKRTSRIGTCVFSDSSVSRESQEIE